MERQVALTFDVEFPDRPNWQVDNLTCVLDTLASEGVPGTFFLQGRWVEACPDQVGDAFKLLSVDGPSPEDPALKRCFARSFAQPIAARSDSASMRGFLYDRVFPIPTTYRM
jgi:hypothetical protein